MATKTKKKIVEGITHGLGGYTNYGCRCVTCTKENRTRQRAYRKRRFAGNPLCSTPKCTRHASRATGNGYCYMCTERMKLEELKEAA